MRYAKYLAVPVLVLAASQCSAESAPSSEIDKLSYSLGAKTGENLKNQEINIDAKQFNHGLTDALGSKKILMSEQEIEETLNKFQTQQMAKIEAANKKLAASNLIKSNAFLQENKAKPNVKTLSSGLQYTVITAGNGKPPKKGDTITVNYRGTLIDGTEFDSSYSRKEASTLQLDNLIPGWMEALTLMAPGAKWRVFIPPALAYGENPAGRIEPNSALIFDIELLSVKRKA